MYTKGAKQCICRRLGKHRNEHTYLIIDYQKFDGLKGFSITSILLPSFHLFFAACAGCAWYLFLQWEDQHGKGSGTRWKDGRRMEPPGAPLKCIIGWLSLP